jgi:TPR repeat protein
MRKNKRMRRIIKRARMGKPREMYLLGLACDLGHPVPAHLNCAAYWMSLAADAGYAPAMDWVKDYFFDDNPTTQANS